MRIVLIIALLCSLSLPVLAQVTDTSDPLQGGFGHMGAVLHVYDEAGYKLCLLDNTHDVSIFYFSEGEFKLVEYIPLADMKSINKSRVAVCPKAGLYIIKCNNFFYWLVATKKEYYISFQ